MYFFFLLFFETIKFYYHFLHGTRNQPLWSFNQTLKIFSYISFFSRLSFLFKYIFFPFYNQIVLLLFILKILFSVCIKWKWKWKGMNGKKISINFERIAKLSICSLPARVFFAIPFISLKRIRKKKNWTKQPALHMTTRSSLFAGFSFFIFLFAFLQK